MTLSEDIYRALYGAALLARFDKSGMDYFDISADGFWRSFIAVAIALPLYALVLMMPAMRPEEAAGNQMGVDLAARLVTWLAILVAMLGLAYVVKCSERYVAFVIAYNWSNVVLSGIVLAVWTLVSLMPGTLAAFLLVVMAAIYGYAYNWLVIREGFGIDGVLAFTFLIVLILVEALVNIGIGALAGGFMGGA